MFQIICIPLKYSYFLILKSIFYNKTLQERKRVIINPNFGKKVGSLNK